MTKKQKSFYDYLQKLKSIDQKFAERALKEFLKFWEKYEHDGVADSMTEAMVSTEAFIGMPVTAHLN